MSPAQQPHGPSALRASDLDRSAVVDILQAAWADGRLTLAEHSERTSVALQARTVGELAELIADLGHGPLAVVPGIPGRAPAPRDLPSYPANRATMSELRRTGVWLVPEQVNVTVLMGTVRLDMREAYFAGPRITVDMSIMMGELQIRVPRGFVVADDTRVIAGEVTLRRLGPARPGAPVIHLTGSCAMGEVAVRGYDGPHGAAGR